MRQRTCIECRRLYDRNAGRKNPYWCPRCDEARIERIGQQLQGILDDLRSQAQEMRALDEESKSA